MKTISLLFTICLITGSVFSQNNTNAKQTVINVPNFADPEVKAFYQSYADHLVRCVQAIREKNEARVTALFKNPGEQLVTQ